MLDMTKAFDSTQTVFRFTASQMSIAEPINVAMPNFGKSVLFPDMARETVPNVNPPIQTVGKKYL